MSCTPSEILTCLGDDALTCNATGDAYEHVTCELGCKTMPMPHCGYIEPRYVPDICDVPAESESFVVASTATFDPNLDLNCNGGVIAQAGAPSICVVHHRRISVMPDVTLRVLGLAEKGLGRPVVFVADEELSISGTLDVSAHGIVNGPGGGVTLSGGSTTVTSMTEHTGGGGAGAKTAGAPGGSATTEGGAANGGAATADPALSPALLGGSSASRSTSGTPTYGGGGGGGAVVLVSCRSTLSISGMVNAGGGGGSPGVNGPFDIPVPGSAGGAGGYTVMQGKQISITGRIFANGGAGGAGMRSDRGSGVAGEDGSTSVAYGGAGGIAANGEGAGGAGGFASNIPRPGKAPSTSPATAGGGGGSVGFLQTYTPEGITPDLGGAQTSPTFQPNATIKTR